MRLGVSNSEVFDTFRGILVNVIPLLGKAEDCAQGLDFKIHRVALVGPVSVVFILVAVALESLVLLEQAGAELRECLDARIGLQKGLEMLNNCPVALRCVLRVG